MRALLVLGGNEIQFESYAKQSDMIICADSGADHAVRQNIKPDAILGDMDSISTATLEKFKSEGVKVITYPAEKDKTDGEISVDYALERGASDITLVWRGRKPRPLPGQSVFADICKSHGGKRRACDT